MTESSSQIRLGLSPIMGLLGLLMLIIGPSKRYVGEDWREKREEKREDGTRRGDRERHGRGED